MVKKLRLGGTQIKSAYWTLVGMASAMIWSLQPVMADTIWDRFSTIMQDIYGQIVAISTIVAVTVGAIALIIRMVSRNQRAVDEATQWLSSVRRRHPRPSECNSDRSGELFLCARRQCREFPRFPVLG